MISSWQNFVPVVPTSLRGHWSLFSGQRGFRKQPGYIVLPAFSLTVPYDWMGASYIIGEFAFSAPANFSFLNRVIKPNDTFCLAVRYVDDPTLPTVVRYKMWEDVGEVLYDDLYEGEVIWENFVLEVWNVQPYNVAVNPTAITIPISLMYDTLTPAFTQTQVATTTEDTTIWTPLPLLPYSFTNPPL